MMNEITSNTSIKRSATDFGLVPKTQAVIGGKQQVLNFKLNVSQEFYDRWTAVLEKLRGRYTGGGGTAIVMRNLEEMLPTLEEIAKEDGLQDEKTPKAKKGGVQ